MQYLLSLKDAHRSLEKSSVSILCSENLTKDGSRCVTVAIFCHVDICSELECSEQITQPSQSKLLPSSANGLQIWGCAEKLLQYLKMQVYEQSGILARVSYRHITPLSGNCWYF